MVLSPIGRDGSELVGELAGSIFFGFYISSATRCSLILWDRFKTNQKIHPYLLITHIMLVLVVTMRSITGLAIVIPPVINQTYSHAWTWSPILIFAECQWLTAVLISDAFVCYRAYVVWSRNIYTQILPVFLLLGSFALAIFRTYAQANSELGIQNISVYYTSLGDITTAFAGTTLTINIFNTGLIAYRIWTVRRRIALRINPSNQLSNLVTILIQSAALYSIVLLIVVIFLNSHTDLLLIFQDIQPSFIGIVFTSVIISVSQETESCDANNSGSMQGHLQLPTELDIQIATTTRSESVGLSRS
ncbi:hypothetical protein GYMLUDRAFT_42517 [Collybiopsis luxurians FD-317 M1]|uniref:Uncharacterized protein n=1 Tax=Collybiopsis luxurians FD-317 M1 TaxID=944289 RepID=A0A0D0CS51_9AGAR|nr:hypothetical protein GYMLUDRAFT_42517 [Collybiopsis luxurians FD-317 M1]